ncbi:MAG: ECF transporter S component [Alistipes sp.]|nr:ECF transporter S component [Alistipes sp.]
MNTTTVKLHSLGYSQAKTYTTAALFILGNIAFPQLCHLIPQGGATLLPIYFFTLLGAYKYGWRVGLLTAIVSPLANSALFGMPAAAAVPAIMAKSILLAVIAGMIASRTKKVSVLLLAAAVLSSQVLGTAVEWLGTGSFFEAMQDFRIGIPGMLLQVFGCWAILKYALKK